MNEERASREGSSRGSGGSRDASGAAPGPVPRQAEQGSGAGAGRRRAAPAEFGAAELAAALQQSVSAIGTSGPPRAGLARIRRRAKARQRRRTVMASSAGVLVLAMGVAAATGRSFDIVPVLTGVVGLGGGAASSGSSPATPQSAGGSGQVRTVRPPAASVGKKGPAIGPAGLTVGTSPALAATGVAQCTAADLRTTTTVDSVIGGVSYGHVDAVATTTCAVAGPPMLQVQNAAGTAVGSVVILRHESSDGSQLPNLPTWGAVLKLQPGQGYDLQFAWAPDSCAGVGAGGATGLSGTAGGAGGQSAAASSGAGSSAAGAAGRAAASGYTLSYLIAGATPTAPVDLNAACGATVYVTDVYSQGEYLLPLPSTTPTPQPSTSSAPAPSQSPTTQPPTSSAPSSTSTSPAAPSDSATTSSGTATASSGASGAANATAADPASS